MRNLLMALGAVSLVVPTAIVSFPGKAEAKRHYNHGHGRYQPRVYRSHGRTYCRHSDGTTGLIAGGVGGALLGNSLAGHGDKTLGTVLGGVGGAFAGRAVDRSMTADRRCR